MFSSQILIDILYKNFLAPLRIDSFQYFPTWTTKIKDLNLTNGPVYNDTVGYALFTAEEPLEEQDLTDYYFWILEEDIFQCRHGTPSLADIWGQGIQILVNSEISNVKSNHLKKSNMSDWYFFYHGFAALDWFRHYKYFPTNHTSQFSHIFISYNHLVTLKRSYRLNLLARLLEKKLDTVGLISAPLIADRSVWFDELYKNKNSFLSVEVKKVIFQQLNNKENKFLLDTEAVHGALSAEINLNLNSRAFLHLVTETVFYDNKLHLTEKIFKPIVSKQPFMLVAAPGNLAYLRSYGFKTFDRWWDESYDNEPDHDKRICMIVNEIEKIAKLSNTQIKDMHQEMIEILEYNHAHFYTNFKEVLVDELISNFKKCINNYNFDRSERFRIPIEILDFDRIKSRLLQ